MYDRWVEKITLGIDVNIIMVHNINNNYNNDILWGICAQSIYP